MCLVALQALVADTAAHSQEKQEAPEVRVVAAVIQMALEVLVTRQAQHRAKEAMEALAIQLQQQGAVVVAVAHLPQEVTLQRHRLMSAAMVAMELHLQLVEVLLHILAVVVVELTVALLFLQVVQAVAVMAVRPAQQRSLERQIPEAVVVGQPILSHQEVVVLAS